MYQTLEDLEIQCVYDQLRTPKFSLKTFFREIKTLLIIFISIFLGMYLITNAQLIMDTFQDKFAPTPVEVLRTTEVSMTAILASKEQEKSKIAEELLQKYASVLSVEKEIAPEIQQLLRTRLDEYPFDFNLLPPGNRLVIASINLDVPVIQTQVKDYAEFTDGSFDKELEN
ncbi:MAG: hypothetical protein LBP53_05760 [Candidatus Peribacteria bacterium]|jgi:hypothetical protein|nr:hypothetical protein [Candidatus Peribacteria bacterium]